MGALYHGQERVIGLCGEVGHAPQDLRVVQRWVRVVLDQFQGSAQEVLQVQGVDPKVLSQDLLR